MVVVAAVVAVAAGAGYFALASKSSEKKVEAVRATQKKPDTRERYDELVHLQPGETTEYVFEREEPALLELEVLPQDGPALMAFGRLEAGKGPPSRVECLEIVRRGVPVSPGKKQGRSETLPRGRYYCAVVNPSLEKPIQVRVRF